jgi:hypothetical protein
MRSTQHYFAFFGARMESKWDEKMETQTYQQTENNFGS